MRKEQEGCKISGPHSDSLQFCQKNLELKRKDKNIFKMGGISHPVFKSTQCELGALS